MRSYSKEGQPLQVGTQCQGGMVGLGLLEAVRLGGPGIEQN